MKTKKYGPRVTSSVDYLHMMRQTNDRPERKSRIKLPSSDDHRRGSSKIKEGRRISRQTYTYTCVDVMIDNGRSSK